MKKGIQIYLIGKRIQRVKLILFISFGITTIIRLISIYLLDNQVIFHRDEKNFSVLNISILSMYLIWFQSLRLIS